MGKRLLVFGRLPRGNFINLRSERYILPCFHSSPQVSSDILLSLAQASSLLGAGTMKNAWKGISNNHDNFRMKTTLVVILEEIFKLRPFSSSFAFFSFILNFVLHFLCGLPVLIHILQVSEVCTVYPFSTCSVDFWNLMCQFFGWQEEFLSLQKSALYWSLLLQLCTAIWITQVQKSFCKHSLRVKHWPLTTFYRYISEVLIFLFWEKKHWRKKVLPIPSLAPMTYCPHETWVCQMHLVC